MPDHALVAYHDVAPNIGTTTNHCFAADNGGASDDGSPLDSTALSHLDSVWFDPSTFFYLSKDSRFNDLLNEGGQFPNRIPDVSDLLEKGVLRTAGDIEKLSWFNKGSNNTPPFGRTSYTTNIFILRRAGSKSYLTPFSFSTQRAPSTTRQAGRVPNPGASLLH
jgi:hypothetical protein